MAASPAWLRVRQRFAIAVLLLAPLLGLAWSLLVPIFRGSIEVEIAEVAAHYQRFVVGTYLGVLMSFAMIPAARAWGRLLRPAAPVGSDVASVLCATGACFHGGVLIYQLAESSLVAGIPDRAAVLNAVNHLWDTSVFTFVLMPFFGFYVGLAALAVITAVRRAGPRWIAPVVILAILIEMVTPIPFKARLMFAMLVPCFAAVAWEVWRLGPEQWAVRDGGGRIVDERLRSDVPDLQRV